MSRILDYLGKEADEYFTKFGNKQVPMHVDILKFINDKGQTDFIRVEEWPNGGGFHSDPAHVRILKDDFDKIKKLLKAYEMNSPLNSTEEQTDVNFAGFMDHPD